MSGKKSGSKFIIGIAVAVLVPLSCFLVVNKLSKAKTKQMPHFYGIERIDNKDGKPDTIYHQVADLVLTNQLGEKVSLNKDLKDKIVIVDFIFTTCTGTCPHLTAHMKRLQASFKKDPKKETSLEGVVQLVSITIDPAHDSVPVLRAYADAASANHDHWWFLTGDKKTIYDYARNELKLTVGPGDGGAEDFIHPEVFVVLDKDRYIRGYYRALNDTDVLKCPDDIVLLTMERKPKK